MHKNWLIAMFVGLGGLSALNAATLSFPATTVLGTNVFSGPQFTVSGNFVPSDTLSVTAAGTVDLASGLFTANAAGIIVSPATTNTGGHPGQVTANGATNFASLLIGNATLGFRQVFASSAAFGLGNPTPPTTISETVPLSAIFGGGFVGLSNGTILEFRISDINTGDNSGAFRVTQGEGAVPEPSTWALLGGGIVLIWIRRRART